MDDCLRLDDDEGVHPARPQPPKGDPEGSVGGPDERASPRHQGGELLAKGEILEQEIAAGTEGRDEHRHRHRYESEHVVERLPCPIRNVNESRWNEVLANDSSSKTEPTITASGVVPTLAQQVLRTFKEVREQIGVNQLGKRH
jgi:hypothetical protein